ncbi:MAG TPA: glycogen/starch synthase [Chitinophagales bacterium]|nr:glycogen/starch synthase [Chitinophagales bacterium]
MEKKRLLFVTHEMDPYLVLTDAAHIVKKLAPFVNDNGLEVRVLMPRFGVINERRNRLHEVVRLSGINIIIDDDDYPLILKVASLPGARIQVYFLDNEEFFKRKFVFHDEEEKFYEDNTERMIFFNKATMETIKKFGWAPHLIHAHGWMSSLIPLYLKTQYAKDPVFANTKLIYSVYEKEINDKLGKNFIKKAMIGDNIKEKDMDTYKALTNEAFTLGAVEYADAVIQGSENIKDIAAIKKAAGKKPFLGYVGLDDVTTAYLDFYKQLLQ